MFRTTTIKFRKDYAQSIENKMAFLSCFLSKFYKYLEYLFT